MITATQLFGNYTPPPDAAALCFYCGGRCGTDHLAKDIVKSSFTALDTVTRSSYVCRGCLVAFDESATITLCDGEVREAQKTRLYSWIIYRKIKYAATKSHRDFILDHCLNPRSQPFAISLSDSGQRQLLYRARVNKHAGPYHTVSLEGEPITYMRQHLVSRLRLMRQVAAATGKPALLEPITTQTGMRVVEYFGSAEVLTAWSEVQSDPLTKLAAWLCPPKEECQREYPERIEEQPTEPTGTGKAKPVTGQRTLSWDD